MLQSEAGHGRIDERGLILKPVELTAIDFPFTQTIVGIQSRRTIKRTGQSTFEVRYYLSSQEASERSFADWIALIRGHWAGVKNGHHWRRDALDPYGRSACRNLFCSARHHCERCSQIMFSIFTLKGIIEVKGT